VVKGSALQNTEATAQKTAAERQKVADRQKVAERQKAAALSKTAAALQKTVTDLLAKKAVDLVIGYGRSSGGDVAPLFVRRVEEIQALEWNQHCTYNLVRYLTDPEVVGSLERKEKSKAGKAETRAKDAGNAWSAAGKVAIVVKGCDLKSLVVLQSENQVQRERLTVIALPCPGVTDETGRLLAKCEGCPPDVYNPREELCDLVVGEPVQRPSGGPLSDPENQDSTYRGVEEIDALNPAERRELWDGCFARCLRCYACRNVCPLCYCKECVFDQHDPRWVSPAAAVASNRSFHLIRAYHLAGRCVDCGECERACPVGIPLRRINRKAARVVEESFHFRAGLDPEAKSPLVAFANEDPQEFIE
jgi:formate dehydrogenase subunit beta